MTRKSISNLSQPSDQDAVQSIATSVENSANPHSATSREETTARVSRTLDVLEETTGQLDTHQRNALDASTRPSTRQQRDDCIVSIVIPVFNEVDTIRDIVGKVRRIPMNTEIVIVDDGSTDGTADVVRQLAEQWGLKAVFKPTNEGKGAALRTGFKHATGEIITIQDADLEYNPDDIPSLVDPIIAGRADVVYGSRFATNTTAETSKCHRWGNALLTFISNATTGLKLTDMETCYKVFRRSALQKITIKQDRFGFEPEITAKIARRSLRFEEVPIAYRARTWNEGKKIGVRDGINALYCIFRYALFD